MNWKTYLSPGVSRKLATPALLLSLATFACGSDPEPITAVRAPETSTSITAATSTTDGSGGGYPAYETPQETIAPRPDPADTDLLQVTDNTLRVGYSA